MTLPKFIITMDGHFRMGMVGQHKELLKPGDQCIGAATTRLTMCQIGLSLTEILTTSANPSGICWTH